MPQLGLMRPLGSEVRFFPEGQGFTGCGKTPRTKGTALAVPQLGLMRPLGSEVRFFLKGRALQAAEKIPVRRARL